MHITITLTDAVDDVDIMFETQQSTEPHHPQQLHRTETETEPEHVQQFHVGGSDEGEHPHPSVETDPVTDAIPAPSEFRDVPVAENRTQQEDASAVGPTNAIPAPPEFADAGSE